MEVIAEFVETTDLIALLADMGIDYVQGYAIGKPMPLDAPVARMPAAKSGELA
jgi:EAL domain-containing protein (putative c-di-GMP-specific phosphodiesterase class I)